MAARTLMMNDDAIFRTFEPIGDNTNRCLSPVVPSSSIWIDAAGSGIWIPRAWEGVNIMRGTVMSSYHRGFGSYILTRDMESDAPNSQPCVPTGLGDRKCRRVGAVEKDVRVPHRQYDAGAQKEAQLSVVLEGVQ
ncbi:hypothetical protein CSOJ01_01598 [Colletotrichum sojae]|uniref:Uncharacterized protein n=1 Tax=Colletotrichum sojae TaxID=2175907 RepID=A0A8H6N495_9PEZI|nr:hypothetical protein CSOJ01_01598 [Colletotrichum sojae]